MIFHALSRPRGAVSPALKSALLLASALISVPVFAQSGPPAEDQGPIVLDTLKVQGAQEDRTTSAAGTKTSKPLVETPQSISVIPIQRGIEQGAQTLQDITRYAVGVRTESYGADARGDWGFVRGIDPLEYLDGMRNLFGYYNTTRTEIFALDRVEILRGPASVLYGQGPVAGLINTVSKRPIFETTGEVGFQIGSFNRRQVQADVSTVLNEKGTLAGRFVGLARKSDTQTDFINDERLYAAPSITWRPTADTEITLLGVLQEDDSGSTTQFLPHSGRIIPNPNGRIPASRFIGEPDFEEYDTQRQSISAFASHRFNDSLSIRQNFRHSWSEASYQSHYPSTTYVNPANPFIDAESRVVGRYTYVSKPNTRSLSSDTQLDAKFDTGFIAHELLFGIDYLNFRQTGQSGADFSTPIDIFAPVYGNYVVPVLSDNPTQSQWQLGLYVQDIIALGEHIDIVAGLRHDWAESKTAGMEEQDDTAITKRIGIIGKNLPGGFAPYFSYAESFLPVIGANQNTFQPYKPQEGVLYEVGVKWQPSPTSPFLVTLALFDMTDKNRLMTDPADPFNSIQTGEVKSRGVEFEAIAWIDKSYEVILSYSFTEATDQGLQLESVPEHLASLWASRYIHFGNDIALQLGAGVRYTGPSWDSTATLETPSVTLFDALIAAEIGDFRFALNGTNLADEDYDATCLARGDCFVGARRTVVGSVTWRF